MQVFRQLGGQAIPEFEALFLRIVLASSLASAAESAYRVTLPGEARNPHPQMVGRFWWPIESRPVHLKIPAPPREKVAIGFRQSAFSRDPY
jgi:hypothetical protein